MTTRRRLTSTLHCIVLAVLSTGANAGQVFFGVPSGNWNVPGNWTGGVLPAAGDQAIVGAAVPGQTVTLSDTQSVATASISYSAKSTLDIQATGDLEVSGACQIGGSVTGMVLVAGKLAASSITVGYGLGKIIQSGGIVAASGAFEMGFDPNNRATFDQNGGANTFGSMQIARHNNAYGTYTITNGSLTTPSLTVGSTVGGAGGTAVFTMAGSANVAVTALTVGSVNATGNQGFMNVNGGTLTAGSINVPYFTGCFGCWTQTAGTVTCPNIAMVQYAGSTGRYVMTSGVLNGDYMKISYGHGSGTVGTMDIYGGMMSLTNLDLGIGTGSVCTVSLYGGTNRVAGILNICVNVDETSTYNVRGGLLDAGTINLGGQSGTVGTLTHAGGEIRATTLAMSSAGDATLKVTLPQAGLNPIQVSGGVFLNDTLTIERANNFKFSPHTVLTLMTYTSRAGVFAQTNLLGGLEGRVNYDVDMGGGLKAITLDQLQPAYTVGTVVSIR